jgi:2-C-methyl-D-erythritol 4-phosphate cytidylyltransferase
MKTTKFYAIIVAGGSGKRMNSSVPKQFLEILGKPVLMHTIEKFFKSDYSPEIILVLPENQLTTWNNLKEKHQFKIPHIIALGGEERFHSVKNGLVNIKEENSIIAIHDAVRPLVSLATINNCFKSATQNGNAIAAITSKDSVRIVNGNKNEAVSRDKIYLIQTPQVFNFHQINLAYQQQFNKDFTDDASVVESAGYEIHLSEGDSFNFKITYLEDILSAEVILKSQQS